MVRRLARAVAVMMIVFVMLGQAFVRPALAQVPSDPNFCDDPANASNAVCSQQVGGVEITPARIREAINSPTPNLANTTAYVFYTISTLLYGTFWVPDENDTTSSAYPSSVAEAGKTHGAIGALSYLTAEMFRHKPASTGEYVADLWNHSAFASQASAQGIGYYALTPILGTWRAFRNVAYYFLVLIAMITGFLVLIRKRVGGNVAVTVQSALPRIVITLLLITFSYAIAGLIVDLMFVILNFIVLVFEGSIFEAGARFLQIPAIDADGRSLRDIAFNTNIFEFTLGFIFSPNGGAWDTAAAISDMIYDTLTSVTTLGGILDVDFIGDLFSNIIQVIFTVILGVALLIAMFKTFFALMMSYAGFVINVTLSPVILLQNALPGNNSYMKWIRNLLAGLAPFVVTVFMIFMAFALTGVNTRAGIGYDSERIAQTGNAQGLRLPMLLAGQIDANAFVGILGMGFILLLPQAVDMSKKMFGADGGVFDKYKNDAVKALQQGWKGNKYVSGKGIVGKVGAGAALGAAGGLIYGAKGGAQAGKYGGKPGRIAGAIVGGAAGLGVGAGLGTAGGGIVGVGEVPVKFGINTVKSALNKKEQYQKQGDELGWTVRDYLGRLRSRRQLQTAANIAQNPQQPANNIPNGTWGNVDTSAPIGSNQKRPRQ